MYVSLFYGLGGQVLYLGPAHIIKLINPLVQCLFTFYPLVTIAVTTKVSGKWHNMSNIDSKRGASSECSGVHPLLEPNALSKIYHVLAAKQSSTLNLLAFGCCHGQSSNPALQRELRHQPRRRVGLAGLLGMGP